MIVLPTLYPFTGDVFDHRPILLSCWTCSQSPTFGQRHDWKLRVLRTIAPFYWKWRFPEISMYPKWMVFISWKIHLIYGWWLGILGVPPWQNGKLQSCFCGFRQVEFDGLGFGNWVAPAGRWSQRITHIHLGFQWFPRFSQCHEHHEHHEHHSPGVFCFRAAVATNVVRWLCVRWVCPFLKRSMVKWPSSRGANWTWAWTKSCIFSGGFHGMDGIEMEDLQCHQFRKPPCTSIC